MASPFQFALMEIRNNIPPEVLQRAFGDAGRRFSAVPVDIDSIITQNVIKSRVMAHANLIGGTQVMINLSGYPRQVPDERSSLYHVPPEALQGREIVSPHSVSYGYGYSIAYSNYNPYFDQMQSAGCGNAGILTAANQLYSAMANLPIVETARVTLIGTNQVLIQDQVRIPDRVYLRATLTHDAQMANIQSASWGTFAKLCVYATKAWIYNYYLVPLNRGAIEGGFELGVIKDVIDGYSDANELFLTYLEETWNKTSRMNDHETHLRHVRNLMGSGW
jgi:hypothetical protein